MSGRNILAASVSNLILLLTAEGHVSEGGAVEERLAEWQSHLSQDWGFFGYTAMNGIP